MSLLIDAGPDFRQQALRYGIEEIDAVLLTHHHFDHVAGLDDLRPYLFRNKQAIPCYGPELSVEILLTMFRYIFDESDYPGIPKLTIASIGSPFQVFSRSGADQRVDVVPIPVIHGNSEIFGYRIGNFAWLTDTSAIPDSSLPLLQDLDVLVLDALRHRSHPKHFSFDEAVDAAERIGARETWFIHMTHDILHESEDARLPASISLAYDGLELHASIGENGQSRLDG